MGKKQIFKLSKIFLTIAVFLAAFLLLNISSFAQENLEDICQWDKIENKPSDMSKNEYQDLLKKCQNYYETRSEELEQSAKQTAREKETLQSEIWTLQNRIQSLEYKIAQGNIMINDLSTQIESTKESIGKTENKIQEVRGNLADLIQLRYEKDQESLLEVFLARQSLADLFDDIIALDALNSETQDLLLDIKNLRTDLQNKKQEMASEKEELEDVVAVRAAQKQESAQKREQQEYFLQITEQEYQNYLREKQEAEKKAAEIAAKIYELIGTRSQITYEQAIETAKYAAAQAGVRPALLLGVLSQESAIGKNVGQCYLKDPDTGSGIVVKSGTKVNNVMKPSRDVGPFLQIIEDLNSRGMNMDPYQTLVSCPMSIGWGGAMGPAQFIPSTWVNAGYKDRVERVTGQASDPWNIKDASLAASFYLKDGISRYGTEGAAVQTYFCGSPGNDYWCNWYEDNVLYLASCHQTFLDEGKMSTNCQSAVGLK